MVETELDGKHGKTKLQYRLLATGLAENSREQNDLCDVIIQVQGVSYHGSRFVLGSASPVFKRMFLTDMRESRSKTIPLNGVSKEGFQVIWDFIYDNRYGTENENIVLAVLVDSHYLQIDILWEEYAEKCKKALRLENAFTILSIAEKLNLKSLQDAAARLVAGRFHEIVFTSDFLSVSTERFQMFLERDDLEVSSEIDIYEAVKKWILHDPSRKVFMPELLSRVRLPILPLDYLQKHIIGDSAILENPQVFSLVLEAKDFHIPELRHQVPSEKTKPRGTQHTLWCMGRYQNQNRILSVSLRDWSFQVLTSHPNHYEETFAEAFSAAYWKLFVTGKRDMKVFDLNRKVWEAGPPPPKNVEWSASAVGLNSIFVSGGRFSTDLSKFSNSVDRFELGSWRWIPSPDLKYGRYAASAVFLESSLHVIGGYPNGYMHERLDARTKAWSELSSWPGASCSPGVTVHNGEIHLAGGGSLCHSLISDVYVYDERRNDWRLLPPMKEKRANYGLISFEGNLYAVGGWNACSVERYDGTDWEVVAQLGMKKCERACIMESTTPPFPGE